MSATPNDRKPPENADSETIGTSETIIVSTTYFNTFCSNTGSSVVI